MINFRKRLWMDLNQNIYIKKMKKLWINLIREFDTYLIDNIWEKLLLSKIMFIVYLDYRKLYN